MRFHTNVYGARSTDYVSAARGDLSVVSVLAMRNTVCVLKELVPVDERSSRFSCKPRAHFASVYSQCGNHSSRGLQPPSFWEP